MADVAPCQVEDLGSRTCGALARWSWHHTKDQHPVLLCNRHAEPVEDRVEPYHGNDEWLRAHAPHLLVEPS